MKRERLMIQAHRIFGCEEIQNSIKAIKRAANSMVDSIETDAWLSKDNEVIIIHGDSDLGKCSLRARDDSSAAFEDKFIKQMTRDEIDKMTYKKLDGERIPILKDLLDAFKSTNKTLNIEIKEMDPIIIKNVIDQFQTHGMLDQLFLSSFHHYHRKVAMDYCKQKSLRMVPFGFLGYSVFAIANEGLLNLTSPGDSVTLSYLALRQYEYAYRQAYESAQKAGVSINIWFDGIHTHDIETLDTYKSLHEMNIHTIITNCPTTACSHVGNL